MCISERSARIFQGRTSLLYCRNDQKQNVLASALICITSCVTYISLQVNVSPSKGIIFPSQSTTEQTTLIIKYGYYYSYSFLLQPGMSFAFWQENQ